MTYFLFYEPQAYVPLRQSLPFEILYLRHCEGVRLRSSLICCRGAVWRPVGRTEVWMQVKVKAVKAAITSAAQLNALPRCPVHVHTPGSDPIIPAGRTFFATSTSRLVRYPRLCVSLLLDVRFILHHGNVRLRRHSDRLLGRPFARLGHRIRSRRAHRRNPGSRRPDLHGGQHRVRQLLRHLPGHRHDRRRRAHPLSGPWTLHEVSRV